MWKHSAARIDVGKLDTLWSIGIYLGIRPGSLEVIVADTTGIYRTRTTKRRPYEKRWEAESLALIQRWPWEIPLKDEQPPKIMPTNVPMIAPQVNLQRETELEPEDLKLPVGFRITRIDLERHGFSERCFGCKALLTGGTKQRHSVACRERLSQLMAGDKRV